MPSMPGHQRNVSQGQHVSYLYSKNNTDKRKMTLL